jgi:hypothetical protein
MARKKQSSSQRRLEGSGDRGALPWRKGMTDREYEWLKNSGVDVERLFKEFFGDRRFYDRERRGQLRPTELGLWKAALALVSWRVDCDQIIRRDEFNAGRRVAINAIRAVPRPPRPLLMKPSEMPEPFRGNEYFRGFRDAEGRERIEASSWSKDGPPFPKAGAPKGPTVRRSVAMQFVRETYAVVLTLVQSAFAYERSDKRQEVISAWEDQARAERCRKALSELELRGEPATAHRVTCEILSMELEQRQHRPRLSRSAIEKLLATASRVRRRPGPREK